jgi:tRNA nucleotidyltransferase (CCA-adding enzyme)
MRRLKSSNADTERVSRLVAHQSDLFPPDAPESGIRRWLHDLGADLVHDLFRLRFALARADARRVGEPPRDLIERWRRAHAVMLGHPPLAVRDLAVGGDDLKALGIPPGPRYGEILRGLLERVLENPELNTRDALLALVAEEVQP